MTTALTPLGALFPAGDLQTGAWIGGRGQVFTSSGTFTIPAGVYAVKVTVVGGGGNGGTLNSASQFNYAAGGGGGGGVAIKYLTSLFPMGTLTVTVGGIAGTSSVASGTQIITSVTATGGATGPTNSNAGGGGGSGSGGDLNFPGGSGGNGGTYILNCSQYLVAGSGGAASGGNGLSAQGVAPTAPGGGAFGCGGVGAFYSSTASGNSAQGYGNGGGGGVRSNTGTGSGGAGIQGFVIVEW